MYILAYTKETLEYANSSRRLKLEKRTLFHFEFQVFGSLFGSFVTHLWTLAGSYFSLQIRKHFSTIYYNSIAFLILLGSFGQNFEQLSVYTEKHGLSIIFIANVRREI